MQSALVTGTSSGIGFETSLALARGGYHTIATMRSLAKADPLRDAAEKEGIPLEVRALDVTDRVSIETLMGQIEVPDVLVNNAGIGGAGPLEIVPEEDHRAIFDTNYFGAIRMIQAVLPGMRERGSGTLANITSGAGRFPAPNQVPYAASKHALEAASDALAMEIGRFGLRVVIIEPGVSLTNVFENASEMTYFDKQSPYLDLMRRNGKLFKALMKTATPPAEVARRIVEVLRSDDPSLRVVIGEDARQLIEGRQRISDAEWVALGGPLSDEEYAARFQAIFGIELS